MSEIPAYKDIDSCHRGKSYMQGVRVHPLPDGAIRNLGGCKVFGLLRKRERFDVFYESLGHDDKELHEIDGATHYYIGQKQQLAEAMSICSNWMEKKVFFSA